MVDLNNTKVAIDHLYSYIPVSRQHLQQLQIEVAAKYLINSIRVDFLSEV